MLCKTNAGGGGSTSSAWAYIGVTYPEGSTCTATNGLYTLSAPDTSGLYVFGVPEPLSTPETWTVTCTDGVKTKSAEVDITTKYQIVSVSLWYSRLPEGYQEVEYLESSGTQYVNIGLFDNLVNTEITLDYMLLVAANTKSVCGSNNVSANVVRLGRSSGSTPYKMAYFYDTQQIGNATLNERAIVVANDDNGNIVENGIVIGSATMSTNLNTRLYLFGEGLNAYVNARVYELTMRNKTTDTTLLHYVPCYRTSDDVAGFYDLANSTFITNSGTGSFIVGADV